ncbi:MAG: AraC family transcriptional regulator [Oceanotoga sp.]|uniref:AraC family transcriptional regulator n=1 Tax=Oceanotoga sp. TaxID=2108366 RepID=UPI00265510D5|nr:AraC family transcriptional regulator [Oceanotoga sp.]
MEWTECISKAINYIEDNITENISIEDISKHVIISPFYFQKGFAMLCGFTVGSYIKKRRLTLAGSELVSSDKNIIDIAFKYGYDSPDSFTKAFTRFHGVTPTSVRNGEIMIKSFAPLKIKFVLDGGYIMDYKIVEKDEFTIIGVSKVFKYNDAEREVPKFWKDFYESGKSKVITSMYGISIDENMNGDEFEYLIADNYNPIDDIQDGFVTKIIPKSTWAIFAEVNAIGTPAPGCTELPAKYRFSQYLNLLCGLK